MADDLDRARNIIARRVVASLADRHGGQEWENHSDIGQHDWESVEDRVAMIIKEIDASDDDYDNAYELLAKRVERKG